MDNKLKIINFLGKNTEKSFTMHQLSKLLDIPYATFHRVVGKMQNLLIINTVGKSKTVEVNTHNPVVKNYLIISSQEERDEFLKKQPLLKKISDELPEGNYSVLLFGSYPKGTQTTKSDIDIIVINKMGEKTPSFSRYETLFKLTINPLYFTPKEVILMLKDKEENVMKQALKNHIIMYNPELFWNLAYGI